MQGAVLHLSSDCHKRFRVLCKPFAALDSRFSFCKMRVMAQVAKSSLRSKGIGASTSLLQTENPQTAHKPGLFSKENSTMVAVHVRWAPQAE